MVSVEPVMYLALALARNEHINPNCKRKDRRSPAVFLFG
jgi:hypothetical protein